MRVQYRYAMVQYRYAVVQYRYAVVQYRYAVVQFYPQFNSLNLALIISTRHWTDLSLARGPEGLIRLRGQRRIRDQMPMMRSRPNNGCEGDYNECCISAAYYYRPKKPVPEFTSDKLKVFLICSLLKDIFVRIF